jgi:hypothetical protein
MNQLQHFTPFTPKITANAHLSVGEPRIVEEEQVVPHDAVRPHQTEVHLFSN